MSFPEVWRAGAAMMLFASLISCASAPKQEPADPVVEAALPEVEGHGFAVRHHDTAEPLERVHEIIDPLALERLTDEVWEAHGLEIVRLRQSDLALIADRLPASSPPGLIWHGQALTWRNLQPPAMPVGDRMMVTGENQESYSTGIGGLAGRGWSMMTLDGPRVLVELAPMIEMRGKPVERFVDLRREFLVAPGEVLLLVAGSGQWPHPPPEDTSVEAMEAAAEVATMGQMLLERAHEEGVSQRLIMVTPRFGDWESELRGG
ncbi:MAG: hypothetical protein CMJ39_07510 [Phycisphaerae bacterium]|nr:hypothetical protein [Phycisphaerae bacterium]